MIARVVVPVSGYRWIDVPYVEEGYTQTGGKEVPDREGIHRVLTSYIPTGMGCEVKIYNAADEDKYKYLHRQFAAVQRTEEAILKFANRYGDLGLALDPDRRIKVEIPGEKDEKPVIFYGNGENFNDWYKEIGAMKRAIELWDAAQSPDFSYLKKHIIWDKDNTYVNYEDWGEDGKGFMSFGGRYPSWIRIADGRRERDNLFPHFASGDKVKPAKYLVQIWVNEKLMKHTYPYLLWSHSERKLEFVFSSNTLLGAIWLHFAHEIGTVGSKRKMVICEVCGEPLESKRSSKKYHERCKKRAYRERVANRITTTPLAQLSQGDE